MEKQIFARMGKAPITEKNKIQQPYKSNFMSQVYQLAVQWGQNKSDLFFEDKETAERTAEFINLMAKNVSNPIHIEAIEHKVYSREVAIEHIIKGLNFGFFLGPN